MIDLGTERRQYVDKAELMHRRLWCLVIHCAVAGCKRGIPYDRQFIFSTMCAQVCRYLNLDLSIIQGAAINASTACAEEVNKMYLSNKYERFNAKGAPETVPKDEQVANEKRRLFTPEEKIQRKREAAMRYTRSDKYRQLQERRRGKLPTVLPTVTHQSTLVIQQQVNDGY